MGDPPGNTKSTNDVVFNEVNHINDLTSTSGMTFPTLRNNQL